MVKKISLLLAFNITYSYTNKDYTLLNFAIFVYVFPNKKRFSKFKRPIKEQNLLCGGGLILIQG